MKMADLVNLCTTLQSPTSPRDCTLRTDQESKPGTLFLPRIQESYANISEFHEGSKTAEIHTQVHFLENVDCQRLCFEYVVRNW